MKFVVVLLLFIVVVTVSGCQSQPLPAAERGIEVTRVVDGDTFEIDEAVVRLLCIDAPEKREPFYLNAKERLRELVDGTYIILEEGSVDKDIYGRLLRYVYVGNVSVNEQLVREGLARAYIYNQTENNCSRMIELEQAAIDDKAGMWD